MIPKDAKLVFKGVLFDVYHWEQEQFDGTKKTFEKLKRKDSVNIIPITSDGKILLSSEEQPGEVPYVTVPGGQIEPGEKPEEAGRRELLEETGYECESLDFWMSVEPYTKIDWTISTYIARNCKYVSDPHPDTGERITLKPVSFDEYINISITDPTYRNTEITLAIMRAMRKPHGLDELKKLLMP